MNTTVKRAKSTALGKKCNPSHCPTKHRKGPFQPKISGSFLEAYRNYGNHPH